MVTERMEAWGVGSLDDHVLVLVDAPAAPFVGNSRLRCAAESAATDVHQHRPLVASASPGMTDAWRKSISLGARRSLRNCLRRREFGGQPHVLTVTSIDKHPASAGFHFGVDRLSLEATSGVRIVAKRCALLDWLLTHPADCFDGGSVAVAGEILALKRHTRAAGLVRVSRALPRRLAARVVAQSGEKGEMPLAARSIAS